MIKKIIKNKMEMGNLSARQICLKIDIRPQTLTDFLNGKNKNILFKNLIKIFKVLNIIILYNNKNYNIDDFIKEIIKNLSDKEYYYYLKLEDDNLFKAEKYIYYFNYKNRMKTKYFEYLLSSLRIELI